jgi:hypothetical protein
MDRARRKGKAFPHSERRSRSLCRDRLSVIWTSLVREPPLHFVVSIRFEKVLDFRFLFAYDLFPITRAILPQAGRVTNHTLRRKLWH